MQVVTKNCSPEVSAELQMVVQLLCLHKHALQQWQSDVCYSKMNFLILNKRFLNGTNIITNTQTCLTKKANIFHARHVRLRIQQSTMMKLHPQQRLKYESFQIQFALFSVSPAKRAVNSNCSKLNSNLYLCQLLPSCIRQQDEFLADWK